MVLPSFIHALRIKRPTLAVAVVLVSATVLFSAIFDKADNTTNLDQMASWSGGPPSGSDTARWTSIVTGANTTMLGTNLSWMGMVIANPGGPVTINSGNMLTLGVAGVNMSAATVDLTLNCAVAINTTQTWSIPNIRMLTVTGIISGTGGITSVGAGTLVMTGTNTYTGLTMVSGGTLQIGSNGTTGAISNSSSITNNGSIVFNRSDAYIYSGLISGTGVVNKTGTGSLTLSGSNTYTGSTTVMSGTLLVTNTTGSATGSGTVSVNSGATLGGAGTINGIVSLTSGGTLKPGTAGPGKLVIRNNLSLPTGTVFNVQINGPSAGSGYAQIVDSGSVSLGGPTLSLTLGYDPAPNDSFVIIDNDLADAISGTFNGVAQGSTVAAVYNSTTYNFKVNYSGGDGNDLVLIANHTATWTGSVNSYWNNPSNWSPSGVPGAGDIALFNATSAACSLTVSDTVGGIVFTNGYSGGFYYNNNRLSVEGDADFRSNGPVYTSVGILEFIGPLNRTFIPRAGAYTANQIKLSGTGVTTVQTNGFRCVNLTLSTGILNLGSGLVDSVAGTFTLSAGTTLDFGSSTLKYCGTSLSLSTAGAIIAGTGTLEFCRSSGGSQEFMPKPSLMHPAIVHSGTDTLRCSINSLRALSFSQSAGRLDLGGTGIDSVNSLSISNGTSASFINLGGSTTRVGGNASFSGQPGNLLNLDPATPWSLQVQGTLTANFAAIRNCNVSGGSSGTATNSYDLGGNTNWTSIMGNPRVEPGDSNLTLGKNVVTGNDSVPVMHLRVRTSSVEGAYLDTIKFRLKQGPVSAVNQLRLFADIDRNGIFAPGTDPWIKDTNLSVVDSSVCFRTGGNHLDSLVTPSDTNDYFLVMDLNSTPISAADTFRFALDPAASVFRGRQTNYVIKGAGPWFDGDTVRGDVVPAVTGVSSSLSNGVYGIGAVVGVTVTFNKSIIVSGGAPLLGLETGTTDRDATYTSGTGSATLTFNYTVQAGDSVLDLDYISTTSLTLNGAAIRDSYARDAMLVLPVPGSANSLSINKDLRIDGIPPMVPSNIITSPNGGEVWQGGSSHTITWNSAGIAEGSLKTKPVALYYSIDGGASFPNSIAGDTTNTGSCSWTLPALDTGTVRVLIKVTDSAGNTANDTSNANFRIDNSAPVIASTCLTSPNGGETWAYGSSRTITWNTGDIQDAKLKNKPIALSYSIDGGTTYPNVIATNLTNAGSYNWTIPSAIGSTVRVRIAAIDSVGNAAYDAGTSNFTIDPALLTVSGLTAQNKSYDGTTAATFSSGTLTGVIGGDAVYLGTVTGSFADKNVGISKPVTLSGITLTGAQAANYTVTNPTGITANITAPSPLSVTGLTAQNKAYDGTTVATFTGGTLVGIQGPDNVLIAGVTGTFTDNNPGVGKPVTVTGITLGGTDAANYTVTNPTGLTAGITAPSAPAINIIATLTNDATPAITLGATGADSMRIALSADTVAAAWKAYAVSDSINVSTGGDGLKKVCAQFKDFAGNTTAWIFDTVFYDGSVPSALSFVILDQSGYTNDPQPDMLMNATEADSMSFNLNGGGWSAWEMYAAGKTNVAISSGGDGQKKVYIRFKDLVGNMSGPIMDSTIFDGMPPGNVTGLALQPQPGNRVSLSWAASASADADSVMIRYSTISYPSDTGSMTFWKRLSVAAGGLDTITGLTEKTAYFISLFVKDTIGNWSGASVSAQMWIRLPDVTPPTNNVTLVATAVNPGTVSLAWNPSAITDVDADSVGIWYKTTGYPLSWDEPLAQSAGKFAKNDSSRTVPLSVQSLAFFGLAVRDSSGNWSSMAASAQDTAQGLTKPGPLSYTRPVVVCTAGVVIVPDTLFNGGGPADTVIMTPPLPQGVSIDGKTGLLSGVPFTGQPGMTYIAMASNAGGTATCTVSVSIAFQRPKAQFMPQRVSGVAPFSIRFDDSSKGFITTSRWSYGDGTIDSMTGPSHTYTMAGNFTVRLVVIGPGGSDTLTVPGCVSVTDTTIPLPVMGLQLSAANCSTAVVSWLPSTSFDVDSVFLAASLTDFPIVPTGGTYHRAFLNVNVTDTLRGLPPGGVHLYASVFTKDFSANWSPALKVDIRLPDGIVPANTLGIALTNAGDTAIAVKVKTDSSLTDADGFGWLCRQGTPATVADSISFMKMPYRDSSFVIYPVRTPGLWYLSTVIHDSSGNLFPVRVDTITIANKQPRIAGRFDVTIREDSLWQTAVAATDWNNDSLVFSLREAPAGATINPGTGMVSWTPGDSSAGVNRFIIECGDFHSNGVVRDTVFVTVLNVNEPPNIMISGDTTVLEDQAYRALIRAGDPDIGDSAKIVTVEMPSWLTLSHDTISGTPDNENVGFYTLRVIVADNAGLKSGITRNIRVVNVNDTPVVQRVVTPAAGYEDSSLTITAFAYDIDAGDSLSFEWLNKPAWLSLTGAAVVPERMEWQFTLTGTPRAGDIGAAGFSFAINDRAGASAQVSDRVVVIDRPNTAIRVKQVLYAAARYSLRATNAIDTLATFVTRLTSLVDSTVIERTIGYNAFVEYYPLVDGRYVFTALAVDASGLRETGRLVDTLVIKNATSHTWQGDSTVWQMLSVPLTGIEAAPLRGSGYLVTWDESGPDRDIYGYYTPSKEVRDAVGGRAYWRKSPDTVDISIDKESLVDSAVNIRLSKAKFGWNMIADPYVYPVAWNSPAQAWRWNGSDFELAGNVLEPWQGYWVMAESSSVVTLDPRPVWIDSLHPNLAKSASAYCMSRSDWRLKLSLSGRTTTDRENAIGMNKRSSDGFDRADFYEPPRMMGQGYIFFPHPEWKKSASEFASDIRRNWEQLNIFEVGIAPWTGADSAVVRIEGYEELAATMSVFVRTSAGITEYNAKSGIALPPSRETRYITLVVTADRALAQKLPIKFFCGDPYPNPVRSQARVQYTLPYEWSKDGRLAADAFIVKITIYDLAGRAIRNLVNHRKAAGRYEAVWDCKMNTGRTVGTGVYMYAVEAGKHRAVKRIMVLR